MAPDVLCSKREQGQVPGALDSIGQTALVLGARASLAAGLDLASLGEKSARRRYFLIVNSPLLVQAEGTDFAPGLPAPASLPSRAGPALSS